MAYLATTSAATSTTTPPSSSSSSNINNNNNNNNYHHQQQHQHHQQQHYNYHHYPHPYHHHQHNYHHHNHHPHHHNNNNNSNHLNNSVHGSSNNNSNNNSSNSYSEERQDVIFRKVRGILNKITPETFDKLSKELVNVGLDSPRTLRGVIYLLFDKALKDLKYSSLYAKLCQELSEKARNFEQEPGPNTFCKFLISKCEDEFERRRKATEDFDSKNELTDEEYEQKAIVKQKMLGNIKFICELGKKRLLQEEILHECIRGLLSKKKERPIQDQAQDLECLCQIMRTIGSLLDIQASRNLMNQYFERIDLFSKKPELPSRIRFMLRDVIDLRNNNWRPRPFQREDNVPQPLSKLREEAGYHDSTNSTTIDKFGNNRNLISLGGLSKMHGNKLSMLLDDDEPSFTTSTDFHWGPSSFLPMDQAFDAFASPPPPPKNATNTNSSSSSSEVKRNPLTTTTSTDTTVNNNSSSSSSTNSAHHQVKRPHHPFQHNDPFNQRGDAGDGVVTRLDARKPLVNNNITPNKHNNGDNSNSNRSYEGTAFEKTPFPETKIVNVRNDRESSLASNPRNVVLPPRMQQQQHNHLQQRDDQPFNNSMPPRRFDGPPRQQNHMPRTAVGGAVSPPIRNQQIRRNIPPGVNQLPPQPPLVHQNFRPDTRNNFGPGVNDVHGDFRGERRFHHNHHNNQHHHHHQHQHHHHNRGEFPENEHHRNSRFSNQNYRQVHRNDRPPPHMMMNNRSHHFFDKSSNNQPESELNFNWRSGPSGTPAASVAPAPATNPNSMTSTTATTQPQPQPQTINHSNTPPANLSTTSIVANVQKSPITIARSEIIDSKIGDEKLVRPNIIPNKPIIDNRLGEIDRRPDDFAYPEKRHVVVVDKMGGPQAANYRNDIRVAPTSLRGQPPSIVNHQSAGVVKHLSHTEAPHAPPVSVKRLAEAKESQDPTIRDVHHTSPARAPIRRPQHEVNQPHQQQHRRQSPPPLQTQQQQSLSTNHSSNQPNQQNYRFSRSMQDEIPDRREPRKFYSPHENQQSRHPDNVNFHNQERNFRPINRNPPQFDTTPSAESDRVPNWRRAVPQPPQQNVASGNHNNNNNNHNNNNNNGLVKEQQNAPNPIPLIPKPPIKISDPNFSLRPSHNLVGSRSSAATAGSNQQAKSITRVDSAASDIAQTKEGNQSERPDNPNNPNGRFQAAEVGGGGGGGTQQNAASANYMTKVTNEMDAEGQMDGSTNDSPSRIQAIELNVKKFMSVLSDSTSSTASNEPTTVNRIATKVKELKIPKNCQHECLVSAMKHSILGTESDRDNVGKLFTQLLPTIFEASSLLNAFKSIFGQMKVLEVETPRVKSLVAGFLSQAISDGLLTLEEVGGVLSGGKHHPLFLLVLQKLEKSVGQAWLSAKFINSKINLMDMLPEIDRSKDRLASVLKDRGLGFLDPMLTIEPDLWEQMKERDPSPAAVYRWIKDNVDQTIQNAPTFAHVLISCILKYIHHNAIERSKSTNLELQRKENEPPQSNKSSPSNSLNSQNTSSDIEKELLTKYQQVLQAMLKDKQMQLATLYALQSFYHGLDFPKGSLLRWFHMLYDMNIVDDDVFFIWKEEINDEFPGKGQALFQVNTWLNWLAEAESEEEEDV